MSKRQLLAIIAASLLVIVLLPLWYVRHSVHAFDDRIKTSEQIQTQDWPQPRVAIVFGAAVYQDDLSTMLEDRVKTAITLYKAGKVDRILVSGDNRTKEYNEPKAMAEYLISHAVDPRHVVIDYAGRSTYETCVRAKDIFGIQRALFITQKTHLSRALYLANSLGIDGYGVTADQQNYGSETTYQQFREIGASCKAFLNIHFFSPDVVRGEKIPIN